MSANTEFSITERETKEVLLRTHDFDAIWDRLEAMGGPARARVSVTAVVDDPDAENDGETVVRDGAEVWEDGEDAFV